MHCLTERHPDATVGATTSVRPSVCPVFFQKLIGHAAYTHHDSPGAARGRTDGRTDGRQTETLRFRQDAANAMNSQTKRNEKRYLIFRLDRRAVLSRACWSSSAGRMLFCAAACLWSKAGRRRWVSPPRPLDRSPVRCRPSRSRGPTRRRRPRPSPTAPPLPPARSCSTGCDPTASCATANWRTACSPPAPKSERKATDCARTRHQARYLRKLEVRGKAQRIAQPEQTRLKNAGITVQKFTKCLSDVEGSSAVLMLASKLRSSQPLRNASAQNEGGYANFRRCAPKHRLP